MGIKSCGPVLSDFVPAGARALGAGGAGGHSLGRVCPMSCLGSSEGRWDEEPGSESDLVGVRHPLSIPSLQAAGAERVLRESQCVLAFRVGSLVSRAGSTIRVDFIPLEWLRAHRTGALIVPRHPSFLPSSSSMGAQGRGTH